MQDILLTIHSYFRWFVLAAALAAIALGALAATGARPWDAVSDRVSLLFTVVMDIQLLIGIVLWVVEERWRVGDLVTWGHPLAMVAAVGLAHVGRGRIDAANSGRERGVRAAFFFGASLLIVLVAIPFYSWPI